MDNLKVYYLDGSLKEECSIPEIVPNLRPEFYSKNSIFQTLESELQSRRKARPHTKTKGEVSGGGKKPYRQKHTGRARQGSRRNPQFVGGGIAFGPRKEVNHIRKVNKRVRLLAFQSLWTQFLLESRVVILSYLDNPTLDPKKTKNLIQFLKVSNIYSKKITLLVRDISEEIVMGARNIPGVNISDFAFFSIHSFLSSEVLLLSSELWEWMKENYFKSWR